jgi:hypothetical protein
MAHLDLIVRSDLEVFNVSQLIDLRAMLICSTILLLHNLLADNGILLCPVVGAFIPLIGRSASLTQHLRSKLILR